MFNRETHDDDDDDDDDDGDDDDDVRSSPRTSKGRYT